MYANEPTNLKDYTKQDSIILNIQSACEASIDLAMHVVSEKKLGLPKASRDAFRFLQEADIIDQRMAKTLMNMVDFRIIAVHDYQLIELDVLQAIIKRHLGDFTAYTKIILNLK